MSLGIDQKKAAANSREREEALAVIVPRLLGAAEDFGRAIIYKGMVGSIIVSEKDDFHVIIASADDRAKEGLFLEVIWREIPVFTARLSSAGSGECLGTRVRVWHWKRGLWEAALFDCFPSDSRRLCTT